MCEDPSSQPGTLQASKSGPAPPRLGWALRNPTTTTTTHTPSHTPALHLQGYTDGWVFSNSHFWAVIGLLIANLLVLLHSSV